MEGKQAGGMMFSYFQKRYVVEKRSVFLWHNCDMKIYIHIMYYLFPFCFM